MNESANCRPCEFKDPLGKTVLNSLSAHIAILDEKGVILETNQAWQTFAARQGFAKNVGFIGTNYLEVCDRATGKDASDAHNVAEGIRSIIRHERDEFLHAYPCHTHQERRWFYMRAVRMDAQGALRIIISHEDITALKLAEEALKHSKQKVENQKQQLEEANIALKVLLRQRENDKLELEKNILANIRELAFPYLERLKIAPLRPRDKMVLDILETHLKDLVSPLLQRLSNMNILLTPQEMQIASLVKDGKSSKEVANILNISETTVHFHRKNLRKKFGLKEKATNLRSYLLSLS
jgi:DNA-binding CsgD family transcriptional regulator